MKQIIIGKNVNYAASKASATADTATSAELLRDGAIGFYLDTGVLIPAAGTGLSTAKKFYIAQGTVNGCITTPLLDKRSNLKLTFTKNYTAPVRQIAAVGFNGTSGTLGLPATILKNDEAYIKIIETTVGRNVFPKQTYTAILAASAPIYDVAAGLANNFNSTNFSGSSTEFILAEVLTASTLTNFVMTGTTPTITFTNQSKVGVLGGTTPTIDAVVGDYIKFHPTTQVTDVNGSVYKVAAISAGVSITLDRLYEGPTQTFTQAEAQGTRIKKANTPTAAGVRLTATADGKHFRLSRGGVIETADITYLTPFNPGSGTYAQIAQLEKDYATYSRGFWNRVGPYSTLALTGLPLLYADSTALYDVWNITTINQYTDRTGMDQKIGEEIYVSVALNNSASSTNTALNTLLGLI